MAKEITPNLSLDLPEIGDSGFTGSSFREAAETINENFRKLDVHNHDKTLGKGADVPYSALTADTDLTLQGHSIDKTSRVTMLESENPGNSPNYSMYFSNNDFFIKDGRGNVSRMTKNGELVQGSPEIDAYIVAPVNTPPSIPTGGSLTTAPTGWSYTFPENSDDTMSIYKSTAFYNQSKETLGTFTTPYVVTSPQDGRLNQPVALTGLYVRRGVLYATFTNLQTGEVIPNGNLAFNISGGLGFDENENLKLPVTAVGQGPPGVAERDLPSGSFYLDRRELTLYMLINVSQNTQNPRLSWQEITGSQGTQGRYRVFVYDTVNHGATPPALPSVDDVSFDPDSGTISGGGDWSTSRAHDVNTETLYESYITYDPRIDELIGGFETPIAVGGDGGQRGPAGQGVPTGGTAGQILSKIDNADYNTQWIAASWW